MFLADGRLNDLCFAFGWCERLERVVFPCSKPSARGMQRESAASPLPSVLTKNRRFVVQHTACIQ